MTQRWDLVLNPTWYWKPVKGIEKRCDVMLPLASNHKPGSSILRPLEFINEILGSPCRQEAAIVLVWSMYVLCVVAVLFHITMGSVIASCPHPFKRYFGLLNKISVSFSLSPPLPPSRLWGGGTSRVCWCTRDSKSNWITLYLYVKLSSIVYSYCNTLLIVVVSLGRKCGGGEVKKIINKALLLCKLALFVLAPNTINNPRQIDTSAGSGLENNGTKRSRFLVMLLCYEIWLHRRLDLSSLDHVASFVFTNVSIWAHLTTLRVLFSRTSRSELTWPRCEFCFHERLDVSSLDHVTSSDCAKISMWGHLATLRVMTAVALSAGSRGFGNWLPRSALLASTTRNGIRTWRVADTTVDSSLRS